MTEKAELHLIEWLITESIVDSETIMKDTGISVEQFDGLNHCEVRVKMNSIGLLDAVTLTTYASEKKNEYNGTLIFTDWTEVKHADLGPYYAVVRADEDGRRIDHDFQATTNKETAQTIVRNYLRDNVPFSVEFAEFKDEDCIIHEEIDDFDYFLE